MTKYKRLQSPISYRELVRRIEAASTTEQLTQLSVAFESSRTPQRTRYPRLLSFKAFVAKTRTRKIILVAPPGPLLIEAKRGVTVGRYTAYKHPSHVPTDKPHSHVRYGKYEMSWNSDGSRHHPGKFPTKVPADARRAAAKALGVSEHLLETYQWTDPKTGEVMYLIEVRNSATSEMQI